MTEPTQAQIEAALAKWFSTGILPLHDRMSAALTAAAKVGKP
jgi:hypothetical protein